MSALFVILPILIVAGAFLWLKPSPRDQFLAKLRSEALARGFRVTSLKVPDTSEFGRVNQKQQIVTLYQKGLRLVDGEVPEFIVLRTTGESGAYLPPGWTWDLRRHLSAEHYAYLAEFVTQLPDSISVVSLSKDAVSVCWDEKDAAVTFDNLTLWLKDVANGFKKELITA